MAQRARPLSPFMHYRWQYTNTLSILHRITGVLLCTRLPAARLLAGRRRRRARALRRRARRCWLRRSRSSCCSAAAVQLLLPPAERRPPPVLRHAATASSSRRRAQRLGRRDRRGRARPRRSGWLVRAGLGGARMSLRSPLGRVTRPRFRQGRLRPLVRAARQRGGAGAARLWFVVSLVTLGGATHANVVALAVVAGVRGARRAAGARPPPSTRCSGCRS